MSTDAYVFVTSPTVGGGLDLARLRGLAIADAHARFRRAAGEDVLFSLGFDTFGTTPKPGDGQQVSAWIEERCAALRSELDAAAISVDWDRSLRTDDPGVYKWSQWLFAKLFEADLVYQRGSKGWYLRTDRFNEENDRRLGELEGWAEPVRDAQRDLLRRVDGFEFDAKALDGTTISLFTQHGDAIAAAEFVALSPQRPEVDNWLEDADVRRRVEELRNGDWAGRALADLPVVDVGMSVQVPSVAAPLPILVSPAVDARYGPAAVLGVPTVDPADKALAKGLPKLGGLAWKVESKPPKTTAAVRYLVDDMPLSRGRAWGAPVPVVHCDRCGAIAVALDQLPIQAPDDLDVTARGATLADLSEFVDCQCPNCGGAAARDAGTLHPRLGAALVEVALAVPAQERASSLLEHPELARRLPTSQTVEDGDANASLLDMRTVAKALRDVGTLAFLADGEPHGPTLMHGSFSIDGASKTIEAAIAAHGSDAVRFALLHAAAPAKPFAGTEKAFEQGAVFIGELRDFAASRLRPTEPPSSIDAGDGLRRRLASWCDTATARATENYARLDIHRATRNVVELLARIQDFERRVVEHRGEVAGADRDAVAIAVATLVQLVSPIAPAVSTELWAMAGNAGAVSDAPWPGSQREPAAA